MLEVEISKIKITGQNVRGKILGLDIDKGQTFRGKMEKVKLSCRALNARDKHF